MTLLQVEEPHDAHVHARLSRDPVVWLTTVRDDGVGHAVPMWFVWDDPQLLLWASPGTRKLAHLDSRPDVALHLDTAAGGTDAVLLDGVVRREGAAAWEVPAFTTKYGDELGGTEGARAWAETFSVPLVVDVARILAWDYPGGTFRQTTWPPGAEDAPAP
ncbi:pyridoxamine 5'-phosphate oxidase-related protein FMN-binding [Beutenbergia cavernae DSM 12333]|uniref:Pyridoxamine 5'-phosphate oxidase-related protein FMN-binding n=1 Tax=Beutenbergia cavernae (strain ATCC BAA-8 / DSM 12333 / CCUG 43141 / JCM 11478 / NBRC 16432 / NCIMB 13614 / HKI 0122) TaxID=471853 RepID=C5C2K2_BEUC1|nr:pyridoxamine 5'-phosphate oxidase family protein [Beutenbergia cavernae]ACQ79688.1 pyridoxamine 5'-phosphate oxidase-related protein FMN-binding [Beutenbergia cavernae DSM 12333]